MLSRNFGVVTDGNLLECRELTNLKRGKISEKRSALILMHKMKLRGELERRELTRKMKTKWELKKSRVMKETEEKVE
jgi:hypothetical protein